MRPIKALLSRYKQKRPANNAERSDYDFAAINTRLFRTMYLLGRTRVELGAHFGLDPSVPLCWQDIPDASTENLIKAANFLGISLTWLVTGEPCTTTDYYVCEADNKSAGSAAAAMASSTGHGSAVVQGSQNTSVVVTHYHADLDDNDRDFVRRYRGLAPKDKATLWSRLFELEEQALDQGCK